ncbi:DegT/DnrJ/EryC1/StrS family aminotransferase [Flavobacterium sp. ZT3R18]|uniref:DegT/DnrJ/EryC1/StrS family aminotransferase n=1 Tax=Flavobacterium sp. ZT3R18 TaxID=2594429 RepID=UPI00117AB4EA|nr:DegT/DnrJ/EryC1/StrS family aminotransferase [Flavobacterium sp. ZT3R18]TRX32435.1 DegT/DnrJ/EryC1/StrS family aminotransferase [Flavobacterium sp. ZT3R18]
MIKFLDLKKINEPYEVAFQDKLKAVLASGWYILGKELQEFETNFANYCDVNYCVGVGNGLDALTLIFKGYIQLGKLQKGDEVIVPANTYIASILAIFQADLVPVLVEPKLESYNIDPSLIQDKITSNTKAILAVHLYGQLAEMDRIHEIARQNNLIVVQDAAQAHGCENKFQNLLTPPSGGRGAGAYSFYPGKNLGALGDGGAVTTNDLELAKTIQSLRNYGSEIKYHNEFIGVNSRLDELQAAFLNLKLPNLDTDNEKRRAIAKRYLTEIKNDKIILPFWDFSSNHVFHLFVIRTNNRGDLQNYLAANNIETMIHYPIAPHQQKAFESWNNLSFPITEKIHREVLSLPISPVMAIDEVNLVIAILNKY